MVLCPSLIGATNAITGGLQCDGAVDGVLYLGRCNFMNELLVAVSKGVECLIMMMMIMMVVMMVVKILVMMMMMVNWDTEIESVTMMILCCHEWKSLSK